MKIFVHYFTVFCFLVNIVLLPSIAHADGEVITHLDAGEPAPFEGTLLNPEAAARILVDLENRESACQIIVDTELARQAADHALDLANANAALTACQTRYNDTLEIKNAQIDFYENQLLRPQGMSKELTFVLGIVAGSLITVGAGYAIAEVAGR